MFFFNYGKPVTVVNIFYTISFFVVVITFPEIITPL